MRNFAKASRLLVQPLSSTSEDVLDPTELQPTEDQTPHIFDIVQGVTSEPSTFSYGDINHWYLLCLDHCGGQCPRARNRNVPLGRAAIHDDATVPEPQHVSMQYGDSELVQGYPAHTRVVSRSWMKTCTVSNGTSLPGARHLLYELSVNKMTGPTDTMLRAVCDGTEGRPVYTCFTVKP